MSAVLDEVRANVRMLSEHVTGLESLVALSHDNSIDASEIEAELEVYRERLTGWEHVRGILESEEAPRPEGIPGGNVQST